MENWTKRQKIYTGILILLLISGGFLIYEYIINLKNEFSAFKESSETKISQLETNLRKAEENGVRLSVNLTSEKNRNDELAEQIGEISGTVGVLEKLSKTDPELLQKYSKVFFLNEHYVPPELREIKKEFAYDESQTYFIHAGVEKFLNQMINNALNNDVKLFIRSAYRSFGTQSTLKSNYTVTYGAGTANQFSADQGYSEHQLGTTIDFTTVGINGGLAGFENTEAYKWLLENAYKYGFILS